MNLSIFHSSDAGQVEHVTGSGWQPLSLYNLSTPHTVTRASENTDLLRISISISLQWVETWSILLLLFGVSTEITRVDVRGYRTVRGQGVGRNSLSYSFSFLTHHSNVHIGYNASFQ